jgi:hypothetical protein
VVPVGHVARIGWVERPARVTAQHAPTPLLLHRGEVFGCWRTGLTELDLLALPDGEHPVDHAAVTSELVDTTRNDVTPWKSSAH